jgi:hypothetical protein
LLLEVLAHWPSHLAKPLLQVKLHAPPLQVGAPFSTPEQAVPHPPQLVGSVLVITHCVPHCAVPEAQLLAHCPLPHTSPALQALPQPPQFAASLRTSTHLSPHLMKPAPQTKPHPDVEQVAVELDGAVQAASHPPQ